MEDKASKIVKLGKMILNDDELKIKVQYNGELFTLRYPNPMEKAGIEAEIARTLGGMPRSSFSDEHLFMVEATAYVNRLAVPEECPDWFKSAWTCYDDRLIAILYGEYLSFRDGLRKRIEEGGIKESSPVK